ncbi:AAA family ATPase [Filimonas lacunae]|nr:ATP-binding protein [Filimonas lacunae]BAV04966.1 cell division protein FtsH [Filimonas lacunae]
MNVYELTIQEKVSVAFEDLFFSAENKAALVQVLKEHTYLNELKKYGLHIDNKILLHGHTGCGKTTTAKGIATALKKQIMIVNLSNVVSARIGDTAKNLKALFDQAARLKAVLFLDEFDLLGKQRSDDDKDVGEMRRLVNSLIQEMDYMPADCLLIAATNHYEMIDTALLRRFQLKIKYDLPNRELLDAYYDKILEPFPEHMQQLHRKYDISYAEVRDYIHTAMKKRIIEELEQGVPVN